MEDHLEIGKLYSPREFFDHLEHGARSIHESEMQVVEAPEAETPTETPETQSPDPPSRENDQLETLTGVTPDIANFLNENGITSFQNVVEMDRELWAGKLQEGGFEIDPIHPGTWPDQADMHLIGAIEDLMMMQIDIKLSIQDITVIEGLSYAVAAQLKEKDISTFETISEIPTDEMLNILSEMGGTLPPELVDTWAMQAMFAINGQTSDLMELKMNLREMEF